MVRNEGAPRMFRIYNQTTHIVDFANDQHKATATGVGAASNAEEY